MGKLTKEQIIAVKAKGFLLDRNSEDLFAGRVLTKNGYVSSEELAIISKAAEEFGNGTIAFTTRLSAEIQGIPYDNIEALMAFLESHNMKTGGTGDKIRPVVSCKGSTCVFGIVNSKDIALEIHDRYFEGYSQVSLPHKFKIAVGGCPNNCAKPDLNDIGLIGAKTPVVDEEICKSCKRCACQSNCLMKACQKSGESETLVIDKSRCNSCGKCIKNCPFQAVKTDVEGVRILIGGRWGREGRKGSPLNKTFTVQEALDKIEEITLYYREHGYKKERFADMIDRIGFDVVESELLSGNTLQRKESILSREIPIKS